MAKFSLEIDGFDRILARLNKLEGNAQKTAEKALVATHNIVTAKAEKAMRASNLPAKGKYKRKTEPNTLASLRREPVIKWNNGVAEVHTGFDISNGGLASIFLMYGTPRMKPVKGLKAAFFGAKTKKEIIEAQSKIFYDEITRLATGG